MTQRNQFIVSICALIVSITAVGLSLFGIHSEHKQKQVDALVSLDQYLHEPAISDARAAVRQGDVQMTIKDPQVHRVFSSFDFAGSLVRHNAVNRDIFLDYWGVPLKILDKRLSKLRAEKVSEDFTVGDYYKDFFWLLTEAKAERK